MLQAINHIPLGSVPVARASADDDLFAKIVADIDFIFEHAPEAKVATQALVEISFPEFHGERLAVMLYSSVKQLRI